MRGPGSGSFTEKKRRSIIKWLRKGMFRCAAASRAKVGISTIYVWCAEGKKEIEKAQRAADEAGVDLKDSALGPQARFYLDVCHAEALAESRSLKKVTSSDDTADARWMLERRHPSRWGRTPVHVEHTGPDGGPIEVNVNDARNAFLNKLKGSLERAGIASPDPEGGPDSGAEGGVRSAEVPSD